MKKSILFAALLCLGNLAVAENLQFVTTLSSPLGTFAQLETADPTVMAKSPVVNFCNTRVSAGTITLNGANSYLQKLNLKASTTLGGNIKEYRVGTGLTVNADSNITGGRLMGSNVTFDGSVDAKSDVTGTLYLSNAATVQGAKTTALTIGSAVQTSGTGSNEELHWSNEYNRDYTSSGSATGSTAYTSYLLKSKTPECTLTAMDCLLGEERKDFDPVTCQCVDSYFLQYKEMTFAATGYECLGRNNFFITNTNTAQYPPPLPSLAMEQYSMDTSPFTYNAWYGLERKTPRELIYQCVFTRNVRIKVTTCDVADQECLKDLCAKYPKDTVFIREVDNGSSYFTNNATKVYAARPKGIYGENGDSYHCDNPLRGPSMNTNGARAGRPCLGFNFLQFWVCDKNGKMDFSMFADDTQSSWAPNTGFQELQ